MNTIQFIKTTSRRLVTLKIMLVSESRLIFIDIKVLESMTTGA